MSPRWIFSLLILLCLPLLNTGHVSSRPCTTNPQNYIASISSANTVVLKTSDGEKFEVDFRVALQSETIKNLIGDKFSGEIIPLSNITGKILAKVIEYCEKHVDYDPNLPLDELKAFDTEFVKVDYEILFDLVLAANDLKIKSLLDLTGQRVGNLMMGKTPEEIRKMFNINYNNCTRKEEEQAFVRENAWAFE